ncbi:hypothetical protein ACEQPO_24925 [Bacillus sp. SL00103]
MGSQSNKQAPAKDDEMDIVTKPFGTAAVIIGIIALAFGLFISIIGERQIFIYTRYGKPFFNLIHNKRHIKSFEN